MKHKLDHIRTALHLVGGRKEVNMVDTLVESIDDLQEENIELASAWNNTRKEIRILKNEIQTLKSK